MRQDHHRARWLTGLGIGAFGFIPGVARADLIWPAVVLETHLLSAPVIALSLAIETILLHMIFGTTLRRSLGVCLTINLISALIGLILLPLTGIIWEFFPGLWLYRLFGIGTFNPLTWTATFLFALALTTGIELKAMTRIFHLFPTRRQKIGWMAANAITVGLALWAALTFPFSA